MMNNDATSSTVHEWPTVKKFVLGYLDSGDRIFNDPNLSDNEKAERLNHLTNNLGQ